MRAVSMEDVEEVVKGMAKNKAPSLDGFTVYFFQVAWNFIGRNIWEVVEESRHNQKVCPSLNATFIALIPKTTKLDDRQVFFPITLYNVIYKIIAIVIVKCLKPLLPGLISPEQTRFVEGWQILDGFVTS